MKNMQNESRRTATVCRHSGGHRDSVIGIGNMATTTAESVGICIATSQPNQ
jgi:hypothetical protein